MITKIKETIYFNQPLRDRLYVVAFLILYILIANVAIVIYNNLSNYLMEGIN